MSKQNKKLTVDGINISIDKNGYISLTDIAKRNSKRVPKDLIRDWLKNQNTLHFLATWEKLNNPNFKGRQMQSFRLYAVKNRTSTTPKKYIEQTGAGGLVSQSGRYGGTYAHTDIALNFCYWLSPSFQVYLIKEFQRLKAEELERLGLCLPSDSFKQFFYEYKKSDIPEIDKITLPQKTYLMVDENNPTRYKIGISWKPQFREKTLTHETPKIKTVATCDVDVEDLLHEKYKSKRCRGEWFVLGKKDVKHIIAFFESKNLLENN